MPSGAPQTDQKVETMDEGFTNEDGSVVVSKKMTRVVTTTKSSYPDEQKPAQHGEELIRLKVNDQVYDGSVDPHDHQIHLVKIVQTPAVQDSQQF